MKDEVPFRYDDSMQRFVQNKNETPLRDADPLHLMTEKDRTENSVARNTIIVEVTGECNANSAVEQ